MQSGWIRMECGGMWWVDLGGLTRHGGRAGKDGEDRGVAVVEGHRVDGAEARQVVFERRVISVPGDDVERGRILPRLKQPPAEFVDNAELSSLVLEARDGRQEVARVGQSVGACSGSHECLPKLLFVRLPFHQIHGFSSPMSSLDCHTTVR